MNAKFYLVPKALSYGIWFDLLIPVIKILQAKKAVTCILPQLGNVRVRCKTICCVLYKVKQVVLQANCKATLLLKTSICQHGFKSCKFPSTLVNTF